jgi:hypothetical protein
VAANQRTLKLFFLVLLYFLKISSFSIKINEIIEIIKKLALNYNESVLCTAVIIIKRVHTFFNKVENHHSYIRIIVLIDKCRYAFYDYDGSVNVAYDLILVGLRVAFSLINRVAKIPKSVSSKS